MIGSIPRLFFLIPAHDEELLVSACVESVCGATYPVQQRRVVVIADNCRDDTAQRALAAGAEVWERFDLVKRGKSEAIGWAIARIDLAQWDTIIILDADSTLDSAFGITLSRMAPLESKVVQANFGSSNEFETWLTRLSGVLGRIRYEQAYPKKQANGLNVPLTGNGMCIGSKILLEEGWHADSITENWELYARWTATGVRICYAQDARLFSQESASIRQSRSQRLRWASGRSDVFRKWRYPILRSRAISLRQKLDALWTLGAPSPVIGGLATMAIAATAYIVLPSPWSPLCVAVALGMLLPWGLATARVLWSHPEPIRTLLSFGMLLPYAVWRIALQIRSMFVGTREGWVRTARR